jgi:hypothetical protein
MFEFQRLILLLLPGLSHDFFEDILKTGTIDCEISNLSILHQRYYELEHERDFQSERVASFLSLLIFLDLIKPIKQHGPCCSVHFLEQADCL